jgi:hypothetical protein
MAAVIIVRLRGGLGNQMFQYALGRRLSLERNVPLKLDASPMEADSLRNFALHGFRIQAAMAAATELPGLLRWPPRLVRKLAWLGRVSGRMSLIFESGFRFDPAVLEAPGAVCLDGYWQSERYFDKYSDQIRSDFQLLNPIGADRQASVALIRNTTAVSVHVRRGDYVTNPVTNSVHGTCTPDWYENAMSRMADAVASPTFFVFSDDPDWARDNLPSRWPCHFVEPRPDGRDFEDMHLMALCRHHILANSSFSWWGAWLNPDLGKRVIAPLRWFNDGLIDTRDLVPERWQRI